MYGNNYRMLRFWIKAKFNNNQLFLSITQDIVIFPTCLTSLRDHMDINYSVGQTTRTSRLKIHLLQVTHVIYDSD